MSFLNNPRVRYYYTNLKLIVAVLLPVLLLSLPANFFDTGESVCLSKQLFDVECYACGMTRACMHLIHLDIAGAYYYNLLSFVAMPILAGMWLSWFLKNWKIYKLQRARLYAL